MKVNRWLVLIVCAQTVLQGCLISGSRYTGSQATGPHGTLHWHPGSAAAIDLTGLHLDVQLQNIRRKWTQGGILLPLLPIPQLRRLKPPLRVWIDITPGDSWVILDPSRVYLKVGGDERKVGME